MTRKWILLIFATLVTVVVWIAAEVSMTLMSREVEVDYKPYLTPLQPTFNEETLDEISEREQEYLLIKRDALE